MGERRIRRVLDRVFAEGVVTTRADGSDHSIFPVAISRAEGESLCDLVVRERAVRTIEIGLGYGISSLYICQGLLAIDGERAGHLALDPHQSTRFAGIGLQLLEEAGVRDLVEHVPEDSQLALPRLVDANLSFDLAFVDGNHRFEWFFVDLFYLGRLVRPGGVIVVDDYQLPAIAKGASFFVMNRGWALESVGEASREHRWAVLRLADRPDEWPFTYFVDF